MMPSSLCACSHPDLEHPLQRSWRGIPHAFWPRMPYPHSALLEQRRSGSWGSITYCTAVPHFSWAGIARLLLPGTVGMAAGDNRNGFGQNFANSLRERPGFPV